MLPASPPPLIEWDRAVIDFGAGTPPIGPLDLSIGPGDRVLLLGPSGCGKSSLALGANGLIPQSVPARLGGAVRLAGQDVASRPVPAWAGHVGLALQNAEDTLCGLTVADEIAFGLENRAEAPAAMDARIDAALAAMGLDASFRARRTVTLSGGEKQRVALAAILALEASLLILDEPTAQLDPETAGALRAMIAAFPADRALLIVDHQLDGLVELMTRVVVLGPGGAPIADGPPVDVFARHGARLESHGIWRPTAMVCAAALGCPTRALSMSGLLDDLADRPESRAALRQWLGERLAPAAQDPVDTLMRLEGAAIAPYLGPVVQSGLDLEIGAGERIAILGRNGTGKSTLAAVIAGILPPHAGRRDGPHGTLVFQDPEHQFVHPSVAREARSVAPDDDAAAVLLNQWDLTDLAERHPFELSQGQKRRLSLLLAGANRPALLVLDEPSYGLDARAHDALIATLDAWAEAGQTQVLVTHDVALAARLCRRFVILGPGGVVADAPARAVLGDGALMARAGLTPPAWAAALDRLDPGERLAS